MNEMTMREEEGFDAGTTSEGKHSNKEAALSLRKKMFVSNSYLYLSLFSLSRCLNTSLSWKVQRVLHSSLKIHVVPHSQTNTY